MKYAIFIITHERADNVKTYDTLRNQGYTGDIRLIVDDLDSQLELYKKKYGKEVIVFDKKKVAERVDTMLNTEELCSPVFARNECDAIAKRYHYSHYGMFDDDISAFNHRVVINGKLTCAKVTDMDTVVRAFIEYLDTTSISTCGTCDQSGMFGGMQGAFKKGLNWNFYQTVFVKTGEGIEFKGLTNQDHNATLLNTRVGKIMLEAYCISHISPGRGTNKGGMQEIYSKNDDYVKIFPSVMCRPDVCMIINSGKLMTRHEMVHPKILSDRWKK